MTRWAALLKGVNVGGNRKLPMASLRAFIEDLRFPRVQTLLASGNVVFDAGGEAAALEALLAREAAARIGLQTEWLVRSHAELARVHAANPFPDAAEARPQHLTVTFHRAPYPPELVAQVLATTTGSERLVAIGRELFTDYGNGIGDSRLPALLIRLRTPAVATARNWNTLTKLVAATAR